MEWYVNEVIKKNKMAFYSKNAYENIIKSEEDEEQSRNTKICGFCEKQIVSDNVTGHFPLTGQYRGPADNNCNNNVTQKQSNFIPYKFHNFSNYDCHLFSKKLVDKKNQVNIHIIPKTNEEYISVTYGCIRFIDS